MNDKQSDRIEFLTEHGKLQVEATDVGVILWLLSASDQVITSWVMKTGETIKLSSFGIPKDIYVHANMNATAEKGVCDIREQEASSDTAKQVPLLTYDVYDNAGHCHVVRANLVVEKDGNVIFRKGSMELVGFFTSPRAIKLRQ